MSPIHLYITNQQRLLFVKSYCFVDGKMYRVANRRDNVFVLVTKALLRSYRGLITA